MVAANSGIKIVILADWVWNDRCFAFNFTPVVLFCPHAPRGKERCIKPLVASQQGVDGFMEMENSGKMDFELLYFQTGFQFT